MLDQVTPLILTYNEGANIGRTLDQLSWARDIVIVDSFSDDQTQEVISHFPQARLFQRKFDNHAHQWNFGLKETGITSEWVMALDADFVLSREIIAEVAGLQPAPDLSGYRAPFVFCINGRKLRGALCPPVTFLYRPDQAEYWLDGHTQKLRLNGKVESLTAPIFHDDRKSLARWFSSQQRYQQLEARKILTTPRSDLDFADRVRRLRVIAPAAMFFYCLIVRGGMLDGRAGWFYAFQRLAAESMLSLFLLEHDLRFGVSQDAREQVRAELADFEQPQ
jgi:glycosyltransferase involved in cell wall biosynthesis